MPKSPTTLEMPHVDTPAAVEPARPQRRKPELGRYWLQIDRQTKRSFDSADDAEAAGLLIKKKFAHLQVVVYDRQESSNKVLENPA